MKEFNEKNIVVEINRGSHLGTGDGEYMRELDVKRAAFLEWVIEE